MEDMQALTIRPPEHYPRATEVIAEIMTAVDELLETRVAYVSGGSVYFSVKAWPAYGQLSGLSRQTMLQVANARGNAPDDPATRDPLDFPLWQEMGDESCIWHEFCLTLVRERKAA